MRRCTHWCDRPHWPYRRQASSHRKTTRPQDCGFPVGAGLPAMRPVTLLQDLPAQKRPPTHSGYVAPRQIPR
ncbi:hypothetical protein FCH83_14300 [Pseudomonas putida]|nr:hypothetical protein [Pseudomonas putida]NTZ01872.1 hypothetical protein [Pseudomonas putida]NTZ21976.1 hypothetical protein [Pseudomonas putida]NTZ56089.1 hypothetical protein [Pseudomonas putida]NTZ65413.1 hypothetical protein [Pseudomonas putida]